MAAVADVDPTIWKHLNNYAVVSTWIVLIRNINFLIMLCWGLLRSQKYVLLKLCIALVIIFRLHLLSLSYLSVFLAKLPGTESEMAFPGLSQQMSWEWRHLRLGIRVCWTTACSSCFQWIVLKHLQPSLAIMTESVSCLGSRCWKGGGARWEKLSVLFHREVRVHRGIFRGSVPSAAPGKQWWFK